MKRRTCSILMMVAIVTLMVPGSLWAGAEDPPTTGTIVGPELWGVVVLDCAARNVATLWVKRIVDCDVETQALVQAWTLGCPTSESDVLYHTFQTTLFGINPNPNTLTPIVTRVKNFKAEPGGAVFSFQVQIKFWQH